MKILTVICFLFGWYVRALLVNESILFVNSRVQSKFGVCGCSKENPCFSLSQGLKQPGLSHHFVEIISQLNLDKMYEILEFSMSFNGRRSNYFAAEFGQNNMILFSPFSGFHCKNNTKVNSLTLAFNEYQTSNAFIISNSSTLSFMFCSVDLPKNVFNSTFVFLESGKLRFEEFKIDFGNLGKPFVVESKHTRDSLNSVFIRNMKAENISSSHALFDFGKSEKNLKSNVGPADTVQYTGATVWAECTAFYQIMVNGGQGSVVYHNSGGYSTNFTNCNFTQCQSGTGGVIYSYTSPPGTTIIRLCFCRFYECRAQMGGAIYCGVENTYICSTVFESCQSDGNGGAIYFSVSGFDLEQFPINLVIKGCNFFSNIIPDWSIYGVDIYSNDCPKGGGGTSNCGGFLQILHTAMAGTYTSSTKKYQFFVGGGADNEGTFSIIIVDSCFTRTANPSAVLPTLPCDTGCYMVDQGLVQLCEDCGNSGCSGQSAESSFICAEECPPGYTPNPTTMRCTVMGTDKACNKRGESDCMDNITCVWNQSEAGRVCTDRCPQHYTKPTTGTTRVCTVQTCTDRTAITTMIGSQCGPSSDNCYVNATTGTTCTDCPVSSHYNRSEEDDGQLMCTLITDCSERVILEDNENDRCGKDLSPSCVLDIPVAQGGTGKCASACSLANFTELTTGTGICIEKECTQRDHDNSARWECGSGNCVWDPQVSGDHKCSEVCIKTEHYGENASKVCVKKQCISRGNDGITNSPCSVEGDVCYYDPFGVTPCVVECTATSHYSGIAENGVCQLKTCDSRQYNALVTPPCGEGCIADTEKEEENITYHCRDKDPGCHNTDHFELVDSVCRPISDCRLRSPNNETEYLCGLGCVLDTVSGKCASNCPPFYDDDLEKGKCNVSFTCLTTVYANKNIITGHASCGESPISACGTFESVIQRLCKNNTEVQNVINRIRSQPLDPNKFAFEKEEVLFDGIFDVSGIVTLNIPTNITFAANPTTVNAKLNVFNEQNTSFSIEKGNITFFHLIVAIPNLLSSSSSSSAPGALVHVSADTSVKLINVSFEAGVGANNAGGDYSLVNNEGNFSLTGVDVNGANTFFTKILFVTNPFFSLHSSNFNDIRGGPSTSIIGLFANSAETGKTTTAITISLTNSSFRNISIGGSVMHSALGISSLTYLLSGLAFTNIFTTSNGAVFFHNGSFSSDPLSSPHVHTVSIGTFEGSLPSTFIDVHVLKEADGVGGALALYGVETLTIGTGCLFRNCTAKSNGGAVFYSAIATQTTSSVEISAKFEDCSVTSPGCTNIGGAVAVYVQPKTNAVVSTDEAQFSSTDTEQDPERDSDISNRMFYVGFTDAPCNK